MACIVVDSTVVETERNSRQNRKNIRVHAQQKQNHSNEGKHTLIHTHSSKTPLGLSVHAAGRRDMVGAVSRAMPHYYYQYHL